MVDQVVKTKPIPKITLDDVVFAMEDLVVTKVGVVVLDAVKLLNVSTHVSVDSIVTTIVNTDVSPSVEIVSVLVVYA